MVAADAVALSRRRSNNCSHTPRSTISAGSATRRPQRNGRRTTNSNERWMLASALRSHSIPRRVVETLERTKETLRTMIESYGLK
jgi:hypothetical protein